MQSIQFLASYMVKIASNMKLYKPSVSELTSAMSAHKPSQWIWCVSASGHTLIPLKCGVSPEVILPWSEPTEDKVVLLWIDTTTLAIEKISPERAESLIYQLPEFPALSPDKFEEIFGFLISGLEAGYFGKLVKPTFNINCLNEWLRYFHTARNHVMVAFIRKAMMKCHLNQLHTEAALACM